MAMLETPSRIWRRIEAVEDRDMPSLPSLPAFEDSAEAGQLSSRVIGRSEDEDDDDDLNHLSAPIHSTPAAASVHTAHSTIRAGSSTSSTARFASSIASRSTKSSSLGLSSSRGMSMRRTQPDSFDISVIPSLPDAHDVGGTTRYSDEEMEIEESKESVPDVYLPPEGDDHEGEQDISLTEALQSISRTSSPSHLPEELETEPTPRKKYDYSVSLRSEPKKSPFDKFRNVALRKPLARTRTPSLSRTTPSPASSPTNSTPHSTRSFALPRSNAGSPLPGILIPLPRSTTVSPAIVVHRPDDEDPIEEPAFNNESNLSLRESQEYEERTMDETDIHISPMVSEAEPSDEGPQQQRQHEFNPGEDPDEESPDEREPTFSSDGAPTQHTLRQISPSHSPAALSSAFSSPAPSATFTPTPAFPRPRARFNVPPPPNELLATPSQGPENHDHDQEQEEADDPLTPHTRRRSFLLSVINSTARPRLKFPTPHPRHIDVVNATPSTAESTPGPVSGVGTNLQTAFAGVTPRPRPRGRMSHPLVQTHVVSPEAPESRSGSLSPASGSGQGSGEVLPQWATPAHSSPYDAAGDRASFISTASSHDLTTHHRANTSYDPVMGLGAQGHGLGRFNAGKLNSYLHGLNRRLQEENEGLVERLRKIEEEKKAAVVTASAAASGRRISGGGGRVSLGGTALGNVKEDVSGEGWIEEKAELEEMVETLRSEFTRCTEEKEEVERALEAEREERTKDKERWKDRMGEVERGVEEIVRELERKLQEAEKRVKDVEEDGQEQLKEAKKKIVKIQGERDAAVERAEKAEEMMESGKELGGELREANERVSKVMGDLRNANEQIQELEVEVMRSDARVDELEKELSEEKRLTGSLEGELQTKLDDLVAEQHRVRSMEAEARKADEELQMTKTYVTELEEAAGAAVGRIESLEDQLASAQQKMERMDMAEEQANEQMEKLEGDAQRAAELARQMEEALEAAEKKMWADEEEVAELKGKVASLEREIERQRERSLSQDPSRSHVAGPTDADLEALEDELDNANKEIGRLTTLLNQSPARKAMDKAKDTKIEMLEKEKEELAERIKALKMTVNEMGTPSKLINASGISPIHRQVLSMSIRAPRTPGAPLRDLSWLNNTATDPTVSPLVAEISRLQRELDRANESIDDKLDKLEDAGLGVVGLTKKLEDARSRIVLLEDEIARLSRREDRRIHRLARARCQKCHMKVDLRGLTRESEGDESSLELSNASLPTEPPTPPTKTSEALRANLQSVNSDLAAMKQRWEEEKRRLLGEKAVLQDAANRLNVQVRNATEEVKKVAETERAGEKIRAGIQGELDQAKRAIADLEANLKSERTSLRTLTTEQNRVQREKSGIIAQLQRTESDMDDVKKQLHKFKQENHELETELRVNANADQKARLLEARVVEIGETIEQLRQERSLLATDHKELQRRFSEISEHANRLRDEYASSQTSHDNRRHQLDLHLVEIDDLRRALSDQADELHRTEAEKDRIAMEKSDVAKTVAALEADLRRVKKDAEAFGRDLRLLRSEKERLETKQKEESAKAERARKQSQTQVRLLNEQLEGQREKVMRAKEELKNHVCAADEQQLSEMKLQHNKESKGLIVQIRYLKAKFTRESSFRSDLGYQKQYLLILLSRFEKSEQTIFASIARIGFPILPPSPVKKPHKLRSVALSIVFLLRVQGATDLWREQSASKKAVAAALQEVRRRRAAVS